MSEGQHESCGTYDVGRLRFNGPTSVDVGGRNDTSRRPWVVQRFNGADISRCRRVCRCARDTLPSWSFNGADISRCRRGHVPAAPATVPLASMGPTSVDVGGVQHHETQEVFAARLLQWGRHQSMSEGRGSRHTGRVSIPPRFNGADISRCRREVARGGLTYRIRTGFNGADISRCRRVSSSPAHRSTRTGFNGADISRCRRARRGAPRSPCCRAGFNGADISRCRRGTTTDGRSDAARSGFNGADISRCRRAHQHHDGRERHRSGASMGPTSVDVGGSRRSSSRTGSSARFNGADISRCRRVVGAVRVRRDAVVAASMGPTSVDVGGRPGREQDEG